MKKRQAKKILKRGLRLALGTFTNFLVDLVYTDKKPSKKKTLDQVRKYQEAYIEREYNAL